MIFKNDIFLNKILFRKYFYSIKNSMTLRSAGFFLNRKKTNLSIMIYFPLNVIFIKVLVPYRKKINTKCGERGGFVKVYNHERVENIFLC